MSVVEICGDTTTKCVEDLFFKVYGLAGKVNFITRSQVKFICRAQFNTR